MKEAMGLASIKPVPNQAYGGTLGQGHPDEARLNKLVGGKHWSEFSGSDLARMLGDDVPLLDVRSFVLLLPALIGASERVLLDKDYELLHFCESFFIRLERGFCKSGQDGLATLRSLYDQRQISELNTMLESLRELALSSNLDFSERDPLPQTI